MVTPFELWFTSPNMAIGPDLLDRGLQSGLLFIADAFNPDPALAEDALGKWSEFIRTRVSSWPGRYGIRLSGAQALRFWKTGPWQQMRVVILAGSEFPPELTVGMQEWRNRGVTICWEYAIRGSQYPFEPAALDAIVLRGYESGGFSANVSVQTLFSHARSNFKDMRIMVQGAESPELAAAFLLSGASGIILDATPLLLQNSVRSSLPSGQLTPGSFQRRLCGGNWLATCVTAMAASDQESVSLGPGALLSSASVPGDLAHAANDFRQAVNSVTGRLLSAGASILDTLPADRLLVQGPMALISNSISFAREMAREQVLPFLALTSLEPDRIKALGKDIAAAADIDAYGLGIAGNPAFTPEVAAAAFAARPPCAVTLSADLWARRAEWSRAFRCDSWFHIQHPAMLEVAVAEGYRHFILEGCESGGHVGVLSSAVLWTLALKTASHLPSGTEDLHFILAGGICSASPILFGMLLAAAFRFRGKLSFQLGTPLLLAEESVACGAIPKSYQQALLARRETQVLGAGNGPGLRIAVTDAVLSEAFPAAVGRDSDSRELARAVYQAYARAVRGESNALFLAGETVAMFPQPVPLRTIVAGLTSYRQVWEALHSAKACVEALDFRVYGRPPQLELAVIGLGGIFPGALNLETFWQNVAANRRQIEEVPPSYWGPGNYRAEPGATISDDPVSYTWFAGRIRDFRFDHFDCLKFHISPKAAEVTDRIHLMLLKATEEALSSAGAGFRFPAERTVVLAGNSMGGEQTKIGTLRVHVPDILSQLESVPEFRNLDPSVREEIRGKFATILRNRTPPPSEDTLVGGVASTLAGRIAGHLGVYGGNFSVDAACASSLAALVVAREMLASTRCSCAVIGGVDSDLTVDTFVSFCCLKALARTISRPFMEGSDGFTMGEGCGVVILKTFEQALKDGDPIYARIVGVGMSSDGQAGSLTLPYREGQVRAIQRACDESGFSPESIAYVEAHGTGTPVGDAIELDVLKGFFSGVPPHSVTVGSVKSHIGHLKSAAGVASLIKAILALHNKTLPPAWIEGDVRREFRQPDFPFRLLPAARPWQTDGFYPRRAAVSSFGFGGSNFHVHLDAMDERYRQLTCSRLLVFSAENRSSLLQKVDTFAAQVTASGYVNVSAPEQLALLGGSGPCRIALVWKTDVPWPDALRSLRAAAAGEAVEGVRFTESCRADKIAFLFPGQGSVLGGPMLQLRDTVPVFASAVFERGAHIGMDVSRTLWPPANSSGENDRRTDYTAQQAATTSLSLALVQILKTLGILPDAVAGHSLGFYAALAASRVLTEQDAIRLVTRRAACFDLVTTENAGCMLALTADHLQAEVLRGRSPEPFYIANLNSPRQTVISLAKTHLQQIEAFLAAEKVEFRPVPVGWGFHSPLVAVAGKAFRSCLFDFQFHAPCCRLYSETTASLLPSDTPPGDYPERLSNHVISPVRFAETVSAMHADGCTVFLEAGGRGTLSRFVRETLGSTDAVSYPLDTTQPDVVHHWHQLFAALYVTHGAALDYAAYVDLFAGHLRPLSLGHAPTPAAPQGDRAAAAAPAADARSCESPPQAGDDIYPAIRSIIAKHTGFAEDVIQPDQALQGLLGVDSLKLIEIGIDIERTLHVNLAGASFPQQLTVMGLADMVRRSGQAVPDKVAPPRRYVLELKVVPPASRVRKPLQAFALLTHDSALASQWQKKGYGPARVIRGTAAAGALRHFNLQTLSGLVYVPSPAVSSIASAAKLLAAHLEPAYHIGRAVVPIVQEGKRDHPFRFLTASLPDDTGIGDALAAFSGSLQLDCPELCCRHVSFLSQPADLAAALYRETAAEGNPYAFVCYSGNRRLVEHLSETDGPHDVRQIVTDDDVILATGGGRGITARAALALSRNCRPTWILTGSTDISKSSPAADEINATVRQLSDQGCSVEYHRCDFSKPSELARLMRTLRRRPRPVTGVIHGAGILSDSSLVRKSKDDFMRVIRVKAASALIIEATLDPSALRFWINFASISAFHGNAGQTDYATANRVLMKQAQRLQRKIGTAKTILWGPWSGVGMASGELLQQRFKASGMAAISPDEGTRFLLEELSNTGDALVAYSGRIPFALRALPASKQGLWAEQGSFGAHVSLVSRRFTVQEPFLRDHRIEGTVVLPGVMALEFSRAAAPNGAAPFCWQDVAFERMVRVPEDGGAFRVRFDPLSPSEIRFDCGPVDEREAPAMRGRFAWAKPLHLNGPAVAEERAERSYSRSELYGPGAILFSGPTFQVLSEVSIGPNGCTAFVAPGPFLPADPPAPAFRSLAAIIDGIFQMGALYCRHREWGAFLPVGADLIWAARETLNRDPLQASVTCVEKGEGSRGVFDAAILSGGVPLVIIHRFRMVHARGLSGSTAQPT
jgi:acyl transferase domain-containing protein/NAD(P)H-dependent flavin oxidoreductase YrpB (nitropropane dioxygenase family)/acyl carrier protein